MPSSAPTLSNTFLPWGRPQSESQASCSLVASTAEARLSSWPFSLSPGWTEDRRGERGPVPGLPPRGQGPTSPGLHSRISSAMALWVRFSSFSSFLATSLLRSLPQGGGRRPEAEGWPDVALSPPCLQPLRHQEPARTLHSPFCTLPNSAPAILPSPGRQGLAHRPSTEVRVCKVDGSPGPSLLRGDLPSALSPAPPPHPELPEGTHAVPWLWVPRT